MRRKIRLTESEFHSLVRRLVRETQEEMMSADFNDEDGTEDFDYEEEDDDDQESGATSKEEAIDILTDYFASNVVPDIRPRDLDRLEDAAENVDTDAILSESDDEYSDADRRSDLRKGKMLQRGAGAAAIPAIIGFLSELPGYVDFPNTLAKAHDLFEQLHLGNYTGPVMLSIIVAAIVAAIKGQTLKDTARGEY